MVDQMEVVTVMMVMGTVRALTITIIAVITTVAPAAVMMQMIMHHIIAHVPMEPEALAINRMSRAWVVQGQVRKEILIAHRQTPELLLEGPALIRIQTLNKEVVHQSEEVLPGFNNLHPL